MPYIVAGCIGEFGIKARDVHRSDTRCAAGQQFRIGPDKDVFDGYFITTSFYPDTLENQSITQ